MLGQRTGLKSKTWTGGTSPKVDPGTGRYGRTFSTFSSNGTEEDCDLDSVYATLWFERDSSQLSVSNASKRISSMILNSVATITFEKATHDNTQAGPSWS